MPSLLTARYRYDDAELTPPVPGADLVMEVGLVFSRPGVGPKIGGRHGGVPLSVGATTTSFRRHDGIEMRLPNTDLVLWRSPFDVAAHRFGVGPLDDRPGWGWLDWNIAQHVAADYERLGRPPGHIEPAPTTDASPIVIIACGARKREHPAAAKDLYISAYHRLSLRAALAVTAPDNIRILSGLHGLLDLDTVVDPYDIRLGDPGSVTADQIVDQAADGGILDAPHVIALAGKQYSRMVTETWSHALTPLAGSRGIGDQQHRLARIAASGPSALFEHTVPVRLPD